MIVRSWRIVKSKHASRAFTGDGARLTGGRWNSRGVPMVYTAGSVSLAVLEMLVHFCSEEVLRRYVLFEVSFDDTLVRRLTMKELPRNWRDSPPPGRLQRIGDAWCTEGASPVLQVPSVIIPTEWNYLLNPGHRDFHRLIIGSKQTVRLDPRLMG